LKITGTASPAYSAVPGTISVAIDLWGGLDPVVPGSPDFSKPLHRQRRNCYVVQNLFDRQATDQHARRGQTFSRPLFPRFSSDSAPDRRDSPAAVFERGPLGLRPGMEAVPT
jgi:hypothetical protein